MQTKEFAKVINALAQLVDPNRSAPLQSLGRGLDRRSGQITAMVSEWRTREPQTSNEGPTLADALDVLRVAKPLFESCAKQALISDLEALLSVAEIHGESSLELLTSTPARLARAPTQVQSLREEVVREYVADLKDERIGSKAYAELLDRLGRDRRVRAQEMIAIANAATEIDLPKSAKKSAALARIRLKHDAYVDSAARSNASGGKSAA